MKIICIGRNYVNHAKELGNQIPSEPLFFLKAETAIQPKGHPFFIPDFSNEIHYEVEIVLLIGKSGVSQSVDDSLSFINGFTIGIDLTDRNFQNMLKEKQLPWLLSKSFSGSAVVSEARERVRPWEPGRGQVPREIRGNSSASRLVAERTVSRT